MKKTKIAAWILAVFLGLFFISQSAFAQTKTNQKAVSDIYREEAVISAEEAKTLQQALDKLEIILLEFSSAIENGAANAIAESAAAQELENVKITLARIDAMLTARTLALKNSIPKEGEQTGELASGINVSEPAPVAGEGGKFAATERQTAQTTFPQNRRGIITGVLMFLALGAIVATLRSKKYGVAITKKSTETAPAPQKN